MKQLIIVPFDNYTKNVLKTTKQIWYDHKMICYVSLNKTLGALVEMLGNEGMSTDKFRFIDTISASLFVSKDKNVTHLNNPEDLSQFADLFLNTAKLQKCDAVIFDSVSSLMVYAQEPEIAKFFGYLFTFFDRMGVHVYLLALDQDKGRPAIKQLNMMVDETREL